MHHYTRVAYAAITTLAAFLLFFPGVVGFGVEKRTGEAVPPVTFSFATAFAAASPWAQIWHQTGRTDYIPGQTLRLRFNFKTGNGAAREVFVNGGRFGNTNVRHKDLLIDWPRGGTLNYRITAINRDGKSYTDYLTLRPANLRNVCWFTINNQTIKEGESVRLGYRVAWYASHKTGIRDINANLILRRGNSSHVISHWRPDSTRSYYYRVSPTQTSTYTLWYDPPAGSAQKCDSVRVTVEEEEPPTCALRIDGARRNVTIDKADSVTLSWDQSNDADRWLHGLRANKVRVARGATRSVSPNRTTTYRYEVLGKDGSTVNCYRTVNVRERPPTCSLNAQDSSITRGERTRLLWNQRNTDSLELSGGRFGSGTRVGKNDVRGIQPSNTTTYTLTVSGPGGTDTCRETVRVAVPPPPKPTCGINASPRVIDEGESVRVWWSTDTRYATRASLNGQTVPLSDARTFSPNRDSTYTITFNGPGGSTSCSVFVGVNQTANEPPPSCDSFEASTASLPSTGGSVLLSWETSNATEVRLSNGVSVPLNHSGYRVRIGDTTVITLTASGPGGEDTCKVTIKVLEAPSCDSFEAATYLIPPHGASVMLSWETSNATEVRLSNGVSVPLDSDSYSVRLGGPTTITLTASGPGGPDDTCSVTINQESIAPPTCTISATRTSINAGDTTTIWWGANSSLADSATFNGESVGFEGSRKVSPTRTTQYTLTVTGPGGSTDCPLTVNVSGTPPRNLSCEFWVFPSRDQTSVTRNPGSLVWLNWEVRGASNVYYGIEGSPNEASVNSTGGSQVNAPGSGFTNNYYIRAVRGGDSVRCDVAVTGGSTPPTPPSNPDTATLDVNGCTITHGSNSCRSTLVWDPTPDNFTFDVYRQGQPDQRIRSGQRGDGSMPVTLTYPLTGFELRIPPRSTPLVSAQANAICDSSLGLVWDSSESACMCDTGTIWDGDECSAVTSSLEVRNTTTGGAWESNRLRIKAGDEVALRWDSTNTTRCQGAGFSTGSGQPTTGVQANVSEPAPGDSRQYQVTCYPPSGSGVFRTDDFVWVEVTASAPTITADPLIVRQGNDTTLSWETNGSTSCEITGPGYRNTPSGDGDDTITIEGESTFTIECTDTGSDSVTVEVIPNLGET